MKRINRARIAAVRMCYSNIQEDVQALYVYKKLTKLAAGTDDLNGSMPDFPVWYTLKGLPADDLLLNIDALVDDILRLFPKKDKPAVAMKISEVMAEAISPEQVHQSKDVLLPVLELMNKYGGPLSLHPSYPVADWLTDIHEVNIRDSYWGWVYRKIKGKY